MNWRGPWRRPPASASELILLELAECTGCGRMKRRGSFCGCPYTLQVEIRRRLGIGGHGLL